MPLGMALSEKQIPKLFESGEKRKEALERTIRKRSAKPFSLPQASAMTDNGGIRNWLPCVVESDGVTINWLMPGHLNTA